MRLKRNAVCTQIVNQLLVGPHRQIPAIRSKVSESPSEGGLQTFRTASEVWPGNSHRELLRNYDDWESWYNIVRAHARSIRLVDVSAKEPIRRVKAL